MCVRWDGGDPENFQEVPYCPFSCDGLGCPALIRSNLQEEERVGF